MCRDLVPVREFILHAYRSPPVVLFINSSGRWQSRDAIDNLLVKSRGSDLSGHVMTYFIFHSPSAKVKRLICFAFAGLFYYIHPNETFPPKSLSEYTFTLPELPKIDVKDYLNQEQFESLRSQAAEHAVRVRDWADDYVLYLRTIGQNVVNKGRQLFQGDDKVYYERV